ncbi:MAG: hypothetical protein A2008_10250 [Candidatus Wallbacteria bacterium GWC2_49_35]|uniref:PABS domain-containing protein n=1 Tax=Candidatus Wallbacteria bacterium GWC2_49_35 TaxID=1817813 RepID=A0A1F7WM19_9BACT|nr:MAG: hypothetical protein A2008_10250 [Candidatus Wallbacteria bacterium GWC2_49_35]HBC73641.1 hypothetical protein [Candidatus Wallbacteria bacterium]
MTYLRISVFLAGAAVMSAEMAAPRLLAPFFGASQTVWTNIIGVILAAMTAGAYVGGRLADRWPSERIYARALALSGVALAAVPFASKPFLAYASIALAREAAGPFILSLVSVSLFFAPPVFMLAMISPWALKLAAGEQRGGLGRVAGELSALAAFGSIVGTFATSFALLPLLGTRDSILFVAAMLVAVGAVRAFERRTVTVAALVAASAIFAALHSACAGPVKYDPGTLYEKDSQYQYVQVVSRGGYTLLLLNEGVCEHSAKPRRGYLTGGYWDCMSVLAALSSKKGEPLRVLILGLAGGTMAWQLDHFYGDSRSLSIDGVEIDPAVVEAGRLHFGLDGIKSLKVYTADARAFVREGRRGPYDLIIADAFRQPYIPFHLTTREFYESCRELLSERGIFAINLGTAVGEKTLVDSFTATFKSAFEHVYIFSLANDSIMFDNHIVVGARSPVSPSALADTDVAAELAASSLAKVKKTWRVPQPPPSALVFTDDHAPVEFFIESMILRRALSLN